MNSSIKKVYTLTGLQSGIYFSYLKDVRSSSYHLQMEIELNSDFTELEINQALELLSIRYEMLRTAIVLPNRSGVPKQVILASRKIPLQIINVDTTADEAMYNFAKIDLKKDFDLQKESLIRTAAVLEKTRTLILISVHHIIIDGWSFNLLLEAFISYLYRIHNKGDIDSIKKEIEEQLSDLPSFQEYIEWENRQIKSFDFWQEYLRNYDLDAQIFGNPPKNVQKIESQETVNFLSKKQTENLNKIAGNHLFTLNTVCEVAWGFLLQKYNYSDDVVFARILSGRDIAIRNAGAIFGPMIHSVPCRIKFNGGDSFIDVCERQYQDDLKATENENVTLQEIQEKCGFSASRIHTVVAFENYTVSDKAKNEGVSIRFAREQTEYPISISYFIENGKLGYRIIYSCSHFSKFDIEIICNTLNNIFSYFVDHPSCKMNEVEFQDIL